ncbi:Ig-like domain-containing protein [Pseudobacteroides cellulosolvens]|uniref:SbsA Ig-like domain-containing protein n=1 Tax=Pseudobacteroides cellulosolvens ATCC 35603 = DSM 2933 TaxID=398512 RepID=A0A0L6JQ36_9FIRM|nr:Ig-like domain-containing protein [Pseudobacteroides cellulosolvens]KNY27898.1 hypothetical protein Bccel_3169 [Pseudobacteroides cellulosolvens ATCC 35603 = DSM 2933]
MNVYALFDNKEAEKINLKFLQPYSKSERVEISYLGSVSDNIRESCDKGIKEAYFLLADYTDMIPSQLSIWFRGFEKDVTGSSTDLAFAASLFSYLIEQNQLVTYNKPKSIFSTGVISKSGKIEKISGLDKKISAAIKLCSETQDNIMLIPSDNLSDLKQLRDEDSVLDEEIENSNLKIVALSTINDLFNVFELNFSQKKVKSKTFLFSIIAALIIISVISIGIKTALNFTDSSNEKVLADNKNSNIITPQNTLSCFITEHIPTITPTTLINNLKQPSISASTPTSAKLEAPKEIEPSGSNTTAPTFITVDPSKMPLNTPEKLNIFSISSSLPKNGDIVDIHKTDFLFYFNTKNLQPGFNFENIEIRGGNGKILSKQIDSTKNILSVNLWAKYGAVFTLIIPEGALTGSNGMINKATNYTFTAKNSSEFISVTSTIPSSGQANVPLNSQIHIVFNELGLEPGFYLNNITITGGAKITQKKVDRSGSSLTLSVEGLLPLTKYTIRIPEGAIENGVGIVNSMYSFSFQTGS